jgi:streptogramin lyase
MTPGGVVTEFGAGIRPGAGPAGIRAGPDGNLWFAEFFGDRIGRSTPLGVITELGSVPKPHGMAAGSDGNLWFTEMGADRIGRINTLGVVTEFSTGIANGASPYSIAGGPDGNLWFTEYGRDRIGRITPIGVVTEFNTGITAGASPVIVTTGPDGNLWFTECNCFGGLPPGGQIGRITTAGIITEFPIPTPSTNPYSITTGPDGNLWFTEENGNNVAKVTLQSPYQALIQQPINPDGTSIFKASRGVIPVKFSVNGIARLSVESSGSRVTHSTTPSCV